MHSYLVAMLGVVTASVVAAVFLHLKAVHLAAAAGLSLVAGVLLTAVGMIIDLARPLLDWTNPQKAIKQNLNVLLALLADVGILTAVFFGGQGADQGEARRRTSCWGCVRGAGGPRGR